MTVTPLTGELAAVRYRHTNTTDGWVEAAGKQVVPGLAIVASIEPTTHGRLRFLLVHTVSGYSFGSQYCGACVTPAAKTTADLADDWTLDREALVAVLKTADLATWSNATRGCADWCEPGDGPKPATFRIGCKTCDWEYDEDMDGFVITQEQADRIAFDHECEPWVEITKPTGAVATR